MIGVLCKNGEQRVFKVCVYDKDAFLPGSRAKGHYVTQLETDSIAEAGIFMEQQVTPSALHKDGRVLFILTPKDK